MKIDSAGKPSNIKPAQGSKASSAKKTSTTAGSGDIAFGGLLSQLQTGETEPSFDAARVEEIKQAIAEGRFSINADAIADRLIASAKELIDSKNN